MPADIFPEINIPVVTVIWQETGLSTPEMEQRVTTYSEYTISSVGGHRPHRCGALRQRRVGRASPSGNIALCW
jgi:Cu/Ag efflux pump CusA